MSDEASEPSETAPASQRSYLPLRVWPALLLIVVMLIARAIPSVVEDGPANLWMSSAFGPALCGILILLWWLLGSRASTSERLIGFFGMIAAVMLTSLLVDKSMIGPGTMVITIPMGTAAFAMGAVLLSRWLSAKRTIVALLMATCGFGFSALLRNEGLWGDFTLGLHWRWNPSAEEQMLASRARQGDDATTDVSQENIQLWIANPEWPEFRGADRTGQQQGPVISSDWTTNPPQQLWKIAVGPGWSSFSVAGKLIFTQEQRGKMETTVCYHADSGKEVWIHEVEDRMDDPLGGPGPRATPTIAGDAVFVMGANGHLTRLNIFNGDVVWQTDLRKVADRDKPMWGFCSSPLVVGSLVIVHAGGKGDKGTLAFDIDSGKLKWSAPAGDHSYSSPQLATVDGTQAILMLTNTGINLLNPANGDEIVSHAWPHNGYRTLQPQVVDGDSIILPTGMGTGTRRIRVDTSADTCTAEVVWTSRKLKSDYNDFVVHQNHAFGFDGAVFTCIDLETGDAKWKRGRYGKGQVLLLKSAELLLVISEKGDAVLLRADPAEHAELARFKVLEGKSWNHPVVVGDRLFVRNSQAAACYRLPIIEQAAPATTPRETP